MKFYGYVLSSFIFLLFFSACSSVPTPQQREQTLNSLIQNTEYKKHIFHNKNFDIFGVTALDSCQNKIIHVYIEGDGLAWINRNTLSSNPTPINPLSLKLMLKDKSKCKIYLARPCQYSNSNRCEKKYWSSARFNSSIIDSYLELLDNIKKEYKNNSFEIIGYSGGGAIAAIVSAKRDDVSSLITVAGNLDIQKWVDIHHISPLYDSLNPKRYASDLENIPQYHYIGKNDRIIPYAVFESFKNNFKNQENIHYKLFDNFTHSKGWVQNWDKIIDTK